MSSVTFSVLAFTCPMRQKSVVWLVGALHPYPNCIQRICEGTACVAPKGTFSGVPCLVAVAGRAWLAIKQLFEKLTSRPCLDKHAKNVGNSRVASAQSLKHNRMSSTNKSSHRGGNAGV